MDRIKRYRTKPLTTLDRDLNIVDLYVQGHHIQDIAKTFGITQYKVRKAVNLHTAKQISNTNESDYYSNVNVECANCGKSFEITKIEKSTRMMHFCSRTCLTNGLRYYPQLGFECYRLASEKKMSWTAIAKELGYSCAQASCYAAQKFARDKKLKWPITKSFLKKNKQFD